MHTTNTKPNINVTPLIDVLLVLLIIFMVISPHRPSRFTAQAPDKPAPEEANARNDNLLVTLNADGTYALNREPAANLGELSQWLHRALDGRPLDRKAVFLKAPAGMPYGRVTQAIDVMKAAGSAPIGLQLEGLN